MRARIDAGAQTAGQEEILGAEGPGMDPQPGGMRIGDQAWSAAPSPLQDHRPCSGPIP